MTFGGVNHFNTLIYRVQIGIAIPREASPALDNLICLIMVGGVTLLIQYLHANVLSQQPVVTKLRMNG